MWLVTSKTETLWVLKITSDWSLKWLWEPLPGFGTLNEESWESGSATPVNERNTLQSIFLFFCISTIDINVFFSNTSIVTTIPACKIQKCNTGRKGRYALSFTCFGVASLTSESLSVSCMFLLHLENTYRHFRIPSKLILVNISGVVQSYNYIPD